MLVLLFHTELQRTDDFSLEVRAGENSFPLTLQDFHKSYFKELFISCFAFLQLLSLIRTLSFAHIFFLFSTAAYPFIALDCFFFIRKLSALQFVLCMVITPSSEDQFNSLSFQFHTSAVSF